MAGDAHVPSVVRAYLTACDQMDADQVDACVTDDVRFEQHSNARGTIELVGRAALRRAVSDTARMIRSGRQTVVGCLLDGDQVVLEVDFVGLLARDQPDGRRAGDRIHVRGVTFLTLRDGRIAAEREFC